MQVNVMEFNPAAWFQISMGRDQLNHLEKGCLLMYRIEKM